MLRSLFAADGDWSHRAGIVVSGVHCHYLFRLPRNLRGGIDASRIQTQDLLRTRMAAVQMSTGMVTAGGKMIEVKRILPLIVIDIPGLELVFVNIHD